MVNPSSKINYFGLNNNYKTDLSKKDLKKVDFSDTFESIKNEVSKVDEKQHEADSSIQDLLAGKTDDITTVVSQVAKADLSFKLLVGVRNKLIEAYKQTMNMPV